MDKSIESLNRTLKAQHNLIACGYEKVTVTGGTAQSLDVTTVGKGFGATYAEIRVESATTSGAIMRYLLLGDTLLPTTTDGMAMDYFLFLDINNGDNLANFRVIAVSGSHTLHVQYFK